MKVPFSIGEKNFEIEAYNTSQEKEILLASSFDVQEIDSIFEILNFKTDEDLSEDEKKVILYKFREISLGDEIETKFVCDNCGQGNDGVIQANNFVVSGERNDEDIKKMFIPFNEDNMQDYIDGVDIDDLDINEYEELKNRIKLNQPNIDFIKGCDCLKCGSTKHLDIGSTKYIIEIMSEDTLMTLYQSYNFLTYFGHYSKTDVDTMYPFERSIFIGLLTKTKEDLNK